jgi:hypothetical protein
MPDLHPTGPPVQQKPVYRLPPTLDPVAAWGALSTRVQEEIGATAIAVFTASIALSAVEPAIAAEYRSIWLGAATEAITQGGALIEASVLGEWPRALVPPLPDLRPLGIRQCATCGATDDVVIGQRHDTWLTPELCSRCGTSAA